MPEPARAGERPSPAPTDERPAATEGLPTSGAPASAASITSAPPELVVPVDERTVCEECKPVTVSPPFEASSRPGDGEWTRYPDDLNVEPPLWRTTLHPHRTSGFVSVAVVAIDLRRVTLEWVVGASDEGADKLESHVRVGLIGGEAVALFNGGFQARHGRWGQLSHGVVLVPPRPEGCGIAITSDGQVELGMYGDVASLDLVSYRQTPPCLVANGVVNPELLAGRDKPWAGKSEKEKTRRRSALGLSRRTSTLFYLVGVEVEAVDLARALVALGVEVGLQLDINWNWTRFFLVGQKAGSPEVHSPLLDGMVMDAGEYTTRRSKRDFFVVRRR